jgi:hypothetical protein
MGDLMSRIGGRPRDQDAVTDAPADSLSTDPVPTDPVPTDPVPTDPVPTDPEVVGRPAVVTIRIAGGRVPGEVRLHVRGTYENLIAYALEPLEVGRHVLVHASRGGRAVEVGPTINGA